MRLPARLAAALWLAPFLLWGGDDGAGPLSLRLDVGGIRFSAAGFGRGWRYGGGLLFRTGRRGGIEVRVERFSVAVAAGAGAETGLASGRMRVTALDADQIVFLRSHGRVRPYALVGVGFRFIDFAAAAAAVPEKDLVDHLALLWGGGIECRLSRRLAVLARARCDMIRTWVTDLPRTEPIRKLAVGDPHIIRLYGLDLALGLRFALQRSCPGLRRTQLKE